MFCLLGNFGLWADWKGVWFILLFFVITFLLSCYCISYGCFTEADLQEEFKKKLKMYAERKNLGRPVYYTKKEGLCFRARVSIGEDWFQSQGLCETVEEAENSAAEAALLALSTDAFHEVK